MVNIDQETANSEVYQRKNRLMKNETVKCGIKKQLY